MRYGFVQICFCYPHPPSDSEPVRTVSKEVVDLKSVQSFQNMQKKHACDKLWQNYYAAEEEVVLQVSVPYLVHKWNFGLVGKHADDQN